jgi:hypothetical protein
VENIATLAIKTVMAVKTENETGTDTEASTIQDRIITIAITSIIMMIAMIM